MREETGASIRLDRVGMVYQTPSGPVEALRDVTLSVAHGEFLSLVGPSGCGKSTLLRIIAGLRPATSGAVSVNGAEVAGPIAKVGMVFQAPVLLKWRTIIDNLMGVYSSAQCVPLSAKVDAAKKFWWATVCIASGVFKDKNLTYVFRPTVHSDQYGQASCIFLSEVAKAKLGKDPAELKVAILHEDGPYGVGVAQAADATCKELGIKVVHNEGYSATSTDLSALVTKLRRARPDVMLHVGYNPDITLFLRQAKEAGLKFSGLLGHGAGYSQYGKLEETFGKDVNLFMDVDPVAAQILDAKALKPGLWDLIQEMLRRWQAQGGSGVAPPHLSMGFNNTYVFLTDVLPRAIKAHGGVDAEALRQAALETDIPIGGTIQGYGVKFYPPGHAMAGQNERAITAVMQYVDGKTTVVWPKELRTADPILPLPPGHAYAP